MKKQTIKRIAISICMLVLIGLVALLIGLYSNYSAARLDWEAEKQSLANLRSEIAMIKQSIEDYKKEQEDFKKSLFQERDVPAFLDEISKYAKKASMGIVDMKTQRFYQVQVPQEVEEVRKRNKSLDAQVAAEERRQQMATELTLAAMPIQIKVKGSFASFVEFINQLQDYEQLLNITNVEINTTSEYPVLDCQFTLQIYSLKTLEEMRI
ncbi:MAG: type 4a pilus biogenesis protein PilO [Candidatus Omnitrophica bacterium]|nr:type 4a pilus biogenesis protein PilO [Candidatus Omnitrophota bacterium]